MLHRRSDRISAGVFVVGCIAASLAFAAPAAWAAPASGASAVPVLPLYVEPQSKPAKLANRKNPQINPAPQYFVEFRARYALSYGHAFLAHGRLNARGEIAESEIAGLHPAGDSSVPWTVGHLVPVPSETGPSDGDLEEEFISARYRVVMNEAQYTRVAAYIRHLQANSPLWHAVLYNCVAFNGRVAAYMGLTTPISTLLYPENWINNLRELNEEAPPPVVGRAPPFTQWTGSDR